MFPRLDVFCDVLVSGRHSKAKVPLVEVGHCPRLTRFRFRQAAAKPNNVFDGTIHSAHSSLPSEAAQLGRSTLSMLRGHLPRSMFLHTQGRSRSTVLLPTLRVVRLSQTRVHILMVHSVLCRATSDRQHKGRSTSGAEPTNRRYHSFRFAPFLKLNLIVGLYLIPPHRPAGAGAAGEQLQTWPR